MSNPNEKFEGGGAKIFINFFFLLIFIPFIISNRKF